MKKALGAFLGSQAPSLEKRVNTAVEAPGLQKGQNCDENLLQENYKKLGGDPIALTQALCFYKKNLKTQLHSIKDGKTVKVSIGNPRYITINDLNKSAMDARLFVLDLETGKVNAYYSAHGAGTKNNVNWDDFFHLKESSNKKNSEMTPRGFFVTGETYDGSFGRSMRFYGVQSNVNDNSYDRTIVMHGFKGLTDVMASSDDADNILTTMWRPDTVALSKGCTMLSPKRVVEVIRMIKKQEGSTGQGSLYYNYFKDEKENGPNYCGETTLSSNKEAVAAIQNDGDQAFLINKIAQAPAKKVVIPQTPPKKLKLEKQAKLPPEKKSNVPAKKEDIAEITPAKNNTPVPTQTFLSFADSGPSENNSPAAKYVTASLDEEGVYYCYSENVGGTGLGLTKADISKCQDGFGAFAEGNDYYCYPKDKDGYRLGTSRADISKCQTGYATYKFTDDDSYYCYPVDNKSGSILGKTRADITKCQDGYVTYKLNTDDSYYCYPKDKDGYLLGKTRADISNCQDGYVTYKLADDDSYYCYPKDKDGYLLGKTRAPISNCQDGYGTYTFPGDDREYCYPKDKDGYTLGKTRVDMSKCR